MNSAGFKQKKTKKFYAFKYRKNQSSSNNNTEQQEQLNDLRNQRKSYATAVKTVPQKPRIHLQYYPNREHGNKQYKDRNINTTRPLLRRESNHSILRQNSNASLTEPIDERISLRSKRSNNNLGH